MTTIIKPARPMARAEIIARRRAFTLPGYASLTDVGLDGDYVSPPQLTSCSPTGPVLLAYHWLDAPTAIAHREALMGCGYLTGMIFNDVVDAALDLCGLKRSDIYITQAFHLLPKQRSATVPLKDVDTSFRQITKHELEGRYVIALGGDAAAACKRAGCKVDRETVHPSARGYTREAKASLLKGALKT